MRSLLRVQTRDKQTRVVLLREKLERGGRVEGVDVVFTGKVDGSGSFQCVLYLSALNPRECRSGLMGRRVVRHTMSFIAVRTRSEVELPRTKIAVFSPSTSCGSRLSSARFTRAFFGLLNTSARGEWDDRRLVHSHGPEHRHDGPVCKVKVELRISLTLGESVRRGGSVCQKFWLQNCERERNQKLCIITEVGLRVTHRYRWR